MTCPPSALPAFSTVLVTTWGGRSSVSTAQPAPMNSVQGGVGASSSMKLATPVPPMSNAATMLKPRFQGKKRLPIVSLLGTTESVARQLSALTLLSLQA